MTLSPARIVNPQITASRSDIGMTQLPLHVQQIGSIADRLDSVTRPELVGCQVAYTGPQAMLRQILAHAPGCEAAPLTPGMGNKQSIKAGWQGQGGAGFEPAFNVPCGGFTEYNDPILMGLGSSDEGGSVAFINRDVLNMKPRKFTYTQPRIQRQRPQRQCPHIKPVASAFIGHGFKVAKERLQFRAPRGAGQEPGRRRALNEFNGITRQLAALEKPGEPYFEGLVVTLDARLFQAAIFAADEESVNGFGCGRPVVGEGAELVERSFIVEDGLFSLASFGGEEFLNSPINGREAVGLNEYQVPAGRGHWFTSIGQISSAVFNCYAGIGESLR